MRVTILGSGSSGGTPLVATGWGATDPNNPRNRRLRPSILVESGTTRILIDTSPDLRQQLLDADVDRLDAVLFTHGHADHTHGIDDLRPVNAAMKAHLRAYADAATWRTLAERFGYVLEALDPKAEYFYKPCLIRHDIGAGDTVTIGDITVTVFDQDHGRMRTLGYRFGKFAYSTDLVNLPEASFAALAGLDVWVVGALTDAPHPTHAHVDKAVGWIERVGPKRAYLTHLSHRLDYETLRRRLPGGIEPAYDGLVIDVDDV